MTCHARTRLSAASQPSPVSGHMRRAAMNNIAFVGRPTSDSLRSLNGVRSAPHDGGSCLCS